MFNYDYSVRPTLHARLLKRSMRRLPVFLLPLFRPGSRQVSRTCKSFPTSITVLTSVCTSMHDFWVGSTMNQKDLEWATFLPVAVAARACDLLHTRPRTCARTLAVLLARCLPAVSCSPSLALSRTLARSCSPTHSCARCLSLASLPSLSLACSLTRSFTHPVSCRLFLDRALRQPYYLPTSVAVAGLAKVIFCGAGALSVFSALIVHKIAPYELPPAPASEILSDAWARED